MLNLKYLWLSSVLFRISTATPQVSVTLHNEYIPGYDVSMTCSNLRPGQCCSAPHTSFRSHSAHVVSFTGLAPLHIAAIWRSRVRPVSQMDFSTASTGCSSEVWRSRTGPGTWTWEMWGEPEGAGSLTPATGASYIEMPKALPPDDTVSNWLDAEGILGLVWGGGKWFTSPAASKALGYAGGVSPKSRLRRDIRSESKGTVYAGHPRRWVYPTYIDVNGTRYLHTANSGSDSAEYRDDSGMLLNLTQLGNT